MNKEKEITPKEEAFCVAFTAVGSETFNNATQSAIEAGYAENSARTQAWRMLKRERIRERIKELYQTAFDENMVTPASVLANVRHDRNMAREQGNYNVAVRCDELEGKYLALWKDNIKQGQQPESELKDRTPQEIEAIKAAAAAYVDVMSRSGAGPEIVKLKA